MKTKRDIGACRNASLNKARKLTMALSTLLASVEGIQRSEPNMDAEFWESVRDITGEINQRLHEANAYNNCMVPAGVSFDRDMYTISEPRSQEVKASGFDPDIPGSNPGAAA